MAAPGDQQAQDDRSAEQAMRESKRSPSPIAGPDGRPLHPLAASLAMGAWVFSLGFDLVSQAANDPGVYTRGAYWLILGGVAFGLVAATLGLLDVLALPRDSEVFRAGVRHLVASDAAVLIFLASFLLRRFLTFVATPWSLVALSVLGLLALTAASWTGLGLTYRWGVRVLDEADQLPGYVRHPDPKVEAAPEAAADDSVEADQDEPVLDDAPADGEDVGVATHET